MLNNLSPVDASKIISTILKLSLFSMPRALCLQIDLNSIFASLPSPQVAGNEDAVVMENPPSWGWTLNVLRKSSLSQISLSQPYGPCTEDKVCTLGSERLLQEAPPPSAIRKTKCLHWTRHWFGKWKQEPHLLSNYLQFSHPHSYQKIPLLEKEQISKLKGVEVCPLPRYTSQSLLKGIWETGSKFCTQWMQEKTRTACKRNALFTGHWSSVFLCSHGHHLFPLFPFLARRGESINTAGRHTLSASCKHLVPPVP